VNFPILLKTDASVRSDETLYYVVASNGIFQVREAGMYRAVTRAEKPVPGLLPEKEQLEFTFPRLPVALLREVLGFFVAVYGEHGGEAIVILFYRPESRTYRVDVPRQTIPGYRRWDGRWRAHRRLSYGEVARPPGYRRFGTIHSHADSPAYASEIDCADERFQDGLHVVFGDLDRSEPSRSACFVANGVRFPLHPDDVLERCAVPDGPADAEWLVRVGREETGWSFAGGALAPFDLIPVGAARRADERQDDGA
jgi:hypothetical protein